MVKRGSLSYAILGAGKVGQALAKALAPKGIVPPQAPQLLVLAGLSVVGSEQLPHRFG
jgi:hypothetical protein